MPANPLITRSRVMLEIASEMVGGSDPQFKQARISFRSQQALDWGNAFYGASTYDMIDAVVRGEALIATMNPVGSLATAYLGRGHFTSPQPVRLIGVIPSEDQFCMVLRPQTGIRTLEDFAAERPPLKIGLRGQMDHALVPMMADITRVAGWDLDDLNRWGGAARYEGNLPFPDGPKFRDLLEGRLDGIFDEAANVWINEAAEAGMTIVAMAESTVCALEGQGYRRAYLRKSQFPALREDVLTIDFSGWPIFVRADLADDIVTQMCAGLDARKHNIPWEGEGPLPVERIAREAVDTPQDVPLHPAAEAFWKSKGYL